MLQEYGQVNVMNVEKDHPCFSNKAHSTCGRIHLPVAKECNIQCRYCNRKYDCANESRPGVTSRVMTAEEAMEYVKLKNTKENNLKVIGIAGPGEPLANEETFKTLALANKEYPNLIKCLSTNGLFLYDKVDELHNLGVSSITVTLNTLKYESAMKIYKYISVESNSHEENCKAFIKKQIQGIECAINKGIKLKINTVFIPGINDKEIEDIAKFSKDMGVTIMNIMPLIPQGEFKDIKAPTREDIKNAQEVCKNFVTQLYGCNQCRADAAGIPSKLGNISNSNDCKANLIIASKMML